MISEKKERLKGCRESLWLANIDMCITAFTVKCIGG